MAWQQSANTVARACGYSYYYEGYFYAHYNFFEEISVESPIA